MEDITDDEDFLELIDLIAPRRTKPVFRQRRNHLEVWTETEFLNRFRLPKEIILNIVHLISKEISNQKNRFHSLTPEEMVLLTLRFYATGSIMIVVGDFLGVDKATAYRIIHRVSRAIAMLFRNYVKMPENEEERQEKAMEFYQLSRFPRCIGAIDCTHIKIQSPGGNDAEDFRNPQGYFSMNVQAVCDASLNLQNVVCRWPGSSQDSRIFNQSKLCTSFENGEHGNYLLVGDSGYPIRKYLITPLAQPHDPTEHVFNEAQIRTRISIERCFGVWKHRFPILALGLKVELDKIEAIVIATAVLHNIANRLHAPIPDIDENIFQLIQNDLDNNDNGIAQLPYDCPNHILDNSTRLSLIQNYFSKLEF